ncbi:MAG: hypothetical protein ACRDYY_18355 [Acidimicrobiales bacterium]
MEAVTLDAPADHRRPSALHVVAGALLGGSVVLHVVAMFPAYFSGPGGSSLASQPDQAALYAVLAAGWAAALAIGLTGPARAPVGAGVAVGLAVTELGFRVSDAGEVFRYGTSQAGAGRWIMCAAWVVGAAGAAAAVSAVRRRDRASLVAEPPSRLGAAPLAAVAVLAVVTGGAFLPDWDHYVGVAASGRSVSFDLGDAFAQPWQVVVGSVIAAVVLAGVPVVAMRWGRRDVGAAAVCGALVVLASQFVAAVVQVDLPVSPAVAGLSPAQANRVGLVLGLRLTGWYTLDVLVALALLATVVMISTARVRALQENSAGTWPRAPLARSDATLPSS